MGRFVLWFSHSSVACGIERTPLAFRSQHFHFYYQSISAFPCTRRSKLLCPGCKTPKTCHDFGVRSKKCLGDTCGEDDSADLVLQEEIKQLELQRSDLLKKRKLQLSLENERLQIELRAAIPFEEQEHEAQETCPKAASYFSASAN